MKLMFIFFIYIYIICNDLANISKQELMKALLVINCEV